MTAEVADGGEGSEEEDTGITGDATGPLSIPGDGKCTKAHTKLRGGCSGGIGLLLRTNLLGL